MNWFRKLIANLRSAQDRANQERWDREQKRRRESLEFERSSAQMRADLKAAEVRYYGASATRGGAQECCADAL